LSVSRTLSSYDRAMTDQQRQVIDEFRANGGRVGGHLSGLSLLLLTTTGSRTGRPRTTALTYQQASPGRFVVVAAAGDPERGPDWLRNLIAEPAVTLEVGDETFAATARVEAGPERDKLFAAFAAGNPQVYGFAAHHTRPVPVITFSRG
jgi:deazaflavin-dependent oxidoreductase (nitroreductase family)